MIGLGAWIFLAAAPGFAPGGPQLSRPVELTVARFYRGAGTTLVDGFCRVSFDFLKPIAGMSDRGASYTVAVTVRDSTGLQHEVSRWSQPVGSRLLNTDGASAVEHFTFAAPPGGYQIDVTVTDSASGRAEHAQAMVSGFAARPRMSDLLVTGSLRRGTPGDTVAAPGEIRKGAVFITAAAHPVLTLHQSRLFYYVEFYPDHPPASVVMRVLDPGGRELTATSARDASVGSVADGLDLAGLPPGDYLLEVAARYPDTVVTRRAPFGMSGFATEARVARAASDPAEDAFAHLLDSQLDSLYQPLIYLMEAGERGLYDGLSVAGKRNYLRTFWAKRDPSPGSVENEAQRAFYASIAVANQRFREGGAGEVPGWRTDRGRIYIRYGEPDETLRRPQSGPTPPYEAWKYTRGRPRRFVFLDETGLGNYSLIFTDERREPSRPDWEAILGREAAADVRRF